MAEWLFALLTLTLMEIVLGIDNIIFIAILVGRLPLHQQPQARRLGLGAALLTRIGLLFSLSWIMRLTDPLFSLTDWGVPGDWLSHEAQTISFRDLILIVGGLFLIGKSTFEIHSKLEGTDESDATAKIKPRGFTVVIIEIAILDIVFSLDSVITAVGMARDLWVMITAMVIAVAVMLFFAGPIGDFVHRHPTMKVLALSFLILIGVMLVADGLGQHINRGYIYFAMGFSVIVELINLRVRKKAQPVTLHGYAPAAPKT